MKTAKKEKADLNETIFAGDSSDGEQLRYIGVDAQYFDVTYLPADGSDYFTSLRKASAGIAADAESILGIKSERSAHVLY